jgi:hypothetical protein
MRLALFTLAACSLLMNAAHAQSRQEPAQSAYVSTQSACEPQRDFSYRASQVAALAAHGADLGTTAALLRHDGFREANPALRWASDRPAMLGATKMALAAGSLWLSHELYRRKHRRWAIASNLITTALITTVAVRNARKLP